MSTAMRIALVSAFPPGGQSLNEYGLHLATELAARPDVSEVIVVADILPQPQSELDLSPKIRVLRVWRFNQTGTALTILRRLRAERVDGAIWNVQMASFGDRELPAALGLMAPMFGRMLGMPNGIIAHNLVSGIDLENTLLKGQRLRQRIVMAGAAAVTWAMTRASYMTVTLGSYAEALQPRYPSADISLVPHGTFDTTERPWVPLDQRPRRIATMGKFGTYKKLETLLSAFDLLRSDPAYADWQLVIGGTDHPNAAGYIDGLRAARAADSGVVFHGYVAEEAVPEFFESARLSVFDYESTTGSSGVLHQTASYGAVPVFPRIGDFVDVCEDEGLSGHHYDPGNAAQMAQAIRTVADDLPAAEEMALSNRVAAQGMPFAEVVDFHIQRFIRMQALGRAVLRKDQRPG